VLDAAQRETGLSGQKARDLLGGFLFSGADVEKSLADISGGEQRRLSLAILVASGANVLILDEPTNHLDIESREALEDALSAFEGAVVLVSHDRALLEAVGTRTLVCEDGSLRSFTPGWATYQRARDQAAEASSASAAAAKRERKAGKPAAPRRSPESCAQGGRLTERSRPPRRSRAVEEEPRPRRLVDPAKVRAGDRATRRPNASLPSSTSSGEGRRAGQRSGRSSPTCSAGWGLVRCCGP
jgi:ATP-binding cassette subfamily F protein 3